METLSKTKLASLKKYLQKKTRRRERTCLIEGKKLISEALNNGFEIETLVYQIGTGKKLRHIIGHWLVNETYNASPEMITKLSELETPPGIIGLVRMPVPKKEIGKDRKHKKYLILDRIADPNNLGAIIRTASWYDWDGIICSKGCVEILNGKVIRGSMGALFHSPVWEDRDLSNTIGKLKERDFVIIGSVPRGGKPLNEKFSKFALIIGSESAGMDESLIDSCDRLMTIPGYGKMESLNAAVSSGIIMDRLSRTV